MSFCCAAHGHPPERLTLAWRREIHSFPPHPSRLTRFARRDERYSARLAQPRTDLVPDIPGKIAKNPGETDLAIGFLDPLSRLGIASCQRHVQALRGRCLGILPTSLGVVRSFRAALQCGLANPLVLRRIRPEKMLRRGEIWIGKSEQVTLYLVFRAESDHNIPGPESPAGAAEDRVQDARIDDADSTVYSAEMTGR